ncbi:hypothetical protein CCP4SC76_2280012 [Gammaproteobacteria bacterium]
MTDAYGRRDTVEDVSREGWLEPEWIDAARCAEGLGEQRGMMVVMQYINQLPYPVLIIVTIFMLGAPFVPEPRLFD